MPTVISHAAIPLALELSARNVLASEAQWIWLPSLAAALLSRAAQARQTTPSSE